MSGGLKMGDFMGPTYVIKLRYYKVAGDPRSFEGSDHPGQS